MMTWSDKQDMYYDLHKLGRLVMRDPRKHKRLFALCDFIARRMVTWKEVKKELGFIGMSAEEAERIGGLCFHSWVAVADEGERFAVWRSAVREAGLQASEKERGPE